MKSMASFGLTLLLATPSRIDSVHLERRGQGAGQLHPLYRHDFADVLDRHLDLAGGNPLGRIARLRQFGFWRHLIGDSELLQDFRCRDAGRSAGGGIHVGDGSCFSMAVLNFSAVAMSRISAALLSSDTDPDAPQHSRRRWAGFRRPFPTGRWRFWRRTMTSAGFAVFHQPFLDLSNRSGDECHAVSGHVSGIRPPIFFRPPAPHRQSERGFPPPRPGRLHAKWAGSATANTMAAIWLSPR